MKSSGKVKVMRAHLSSHPPYPAPRAGHHRAQVLERDAKLSELEDKSEMLMDGSFRFKRTSQRLKRQQWYVVCPPVCLSVGTVCLILYPLTIL